jgi:2-methylcitrate dehydratase
MTAIALIFGRLEAADYEDEVASDPRVDALRAKMEVAENESFTADYYDPDKRFIGNAVQAFFSDGTSTQRVAIDYPIGHPRRRKEGIPLLRQKFERAVAAHFRAEQAERILSLIEPTDQLDALTVEEFMTVLASE